MLNNIVLIGYFNEVHDLIDRIGINISAIVDPSYNIVTNPNIHIYSSDKNFLEKKFNKNVFISPDLPQVRKNLYRLYTEAGHQSVTLICPTALISPTAKIGYSSCIQSGCNISSNVSIGVGVKVNTQVNIMHDTNIGDFTTIAPNAVLLGRVGVGCNTYIGANATILPGVHIGSHVTVGAGSVVTKNVPDGLVVCGNPARKL